MNLSHTTALIAGCLGCGVIVSRIMSTASPPADGVVSGGRIVAAPSSMGEIFDAGTPLAGVGTWSAVAPSAEMG